MAKKSTILFAENNPFFLELYADKFLKKGLDVKVARNGEEVLTMLNDSVPALLLLELSLGGMNGFEVLRIMRHNQSWKKVPVAVWTNDHKTESRNKAESFGVSGYFLKSAHAPDEFVFKIKSLIDSI